MLYNLLILAVAMLLAYQIIMWIVENAPEDALDRALDGRQKEMEGEDDE